MQVKDVPAIVTGGASGLGAATARALAEAGAKVGIFDRDIERAEALAAELGALAVECDVTSPSSAEAAVARLHTCAVPSRFAPTPIRSPRWWRGRRPPWSGERVARCASIR